MIPATAKPVTRQATPTTTGTHTGMSVGHSGLEGVVLTGTLDCGSVDSEPVESGTEDVWSVDTGTEDTVLVSVVGVGTTGPRLLTLVKMKGLAYWKHKREQGHQCKKKNSCSIV